jgi:hypothetical protein
VKKMLDSKQAPALSFLFSHRSLIHRIKQRRIPTRPISH